MKTICFLIPGRLDKPVGGHKVIYDYANRLTADGIGVIIANCVFMPSKSSLSVELLRKVYAIGRFTGRAMAGNNTCRKWFELDSRVEEKSVWTFDKRYMPVADIYVATAAVTARFLLDYPVDNNQKVYFIQGYENWNMTDNELKKTYHLPFVKVVISKWLKALLETENVGSLLVPNGFSTDEFYCTIPVEHKNKYAVSMMYHTMPLKNCKMAFEALEKVKFVFPELRVNIFGVYERPADLPDWYSYYQSPDKKTHLRINNESAIYIAPSSSEGFGLTIGEAMMCGQAVACTDAKGYLEMAVDGENALVSPVGDAHSLAENILKLIREDELRFRLAESGRKHISLFSVDNSYKRFKSVLKV